VIVTIVVLVLLTLLALVGLILGIRELHQVWEASAEEARIEREIRRAERRLHTMASNAFSAMLDTARGQRHNGSSGWQ
jgi:predicted Holliday junction resolvase-like endonuclease